MRILHIVGTMSAESGGPAEVARMLVEFAPAHVSSEIATCDFPDEPALATLPCPVHALGHTRHGFFYSPQLGPWLRANRARFDGVIVHGIWTYPSLAAWRALAGDIPYAVFTHGMLDPWFKRAYPLKHLKKWAYWLVAQYWILRRAHRVLFTTETERDQARQSFWLSHWTPLVFPIGSAPPLPPTTEAREAFLDLCPEVRDQRFFLFLGRIDRKKGCDILVKAFHILATVCPEFHLVMAGPDPANWRPELSAIAENGGSANRVHWPGMLKGPAKSGAFDLCEAFVLPSHQENFGIAVVEALAAGRPVLISNKVNIAPEIAASKCGFVENDTLEGTVDLLVRWAKSSDETRAAMSAQARHTFEARYNMQHNAEAILRIFGKETR